MASQPGRAWPGRGCAGRPAGWKRSGAPGCSHPRPQQAGKRAACPLAAPELRGLGAAALRRVPHAVEEARVVAVHHPPHHRAAAGQRHRGGRRHAAAAAGARRVRAHGGGCSPRRRGRRCRCAHGCCGRGRRCSRGRGGRGGRQVWHRLSHGQCDRAGQLLILRQVRHRRQVMVCTRSSCRRCCCCPRRCCCRRRHRRRRGRPRGDRQAVTGLDSSVSQGAVGGQGQRAGREAGLELLAVCGHAGGLRQHRPALGWVRMWGPSSGAQCDSVGARSLLQTQSAASGLESSAAAQAGMGRTGRRRRWCRAPP